MYREGVSIVLPCLNEENTLGMCIDEIRDSMKNNLIDYEIVVADNGSEDNSRQIAMNKGANLVKVPIKGYGAALDAGIRSAKYEYVVMADADYSYSFKETLNFVNELENIGSDLVVGNRFKGSIENGAMPWLHKYIGNPVLSFLAKNLFDIPIKDFHCGIRAVRKSSYTALDCKSKGMEFASEMIVKFNDKNFKITEIPTILRRDRRNRKPHLRSFPDGWRHLKLILLFAPQFMFIFPGLAIMALAFIGMFQYLISGNIKIGFAIGKIQSSLFLLSFYLIGLQLLLFGLISFANAKKNGLSKFRWLNINISTVAKIPNLVASFFIFLVGFGLLSSILIRWISLNFSYIDPNNYTKLTIFGSALMLTGGNTLLTLIQIRMINSKNWT